MRAKIDIAAAAAAAAAADFFPIERIFRSEASFGGKKEGAASESDATMYRINATRGGVAFRSSFAS